MPLPTTRCAFGTPSCTGARPRCPAPATAPAADHQGLTLVHFLAQRKHILLDTLGASFSPSLLDRGTRGGVTKMA